MKQGNNVFIPAAEVISVAVKQGNVVSLYIIYIIARLTLVCVVCVILYLFEGKKYVN